MGTDSDARNANPRGSRKAALFQAYREGGSAFLSGVAEADCPYIGSKSYAAWRIGWSDMEIRARIPRGDARGSKRASRELTRSIHRNWTLLSYTVQHQVINWMNENRNVPTV